MTTVVVNGLTLRRSPEGDLPVVVQVSGEFALFSRPELKVERGEPRIRIAAKYLEGAPVRFAERRRTVDYVTIAGDGLLVGEANRLLDHVVAQSENHWGKEKCFVEHLQARNANVLEVEMAVARGGAPALVATIRTRDGDVELR